MIPLQDKNPTDRFPFVTVLLIVANVYVFGYELSLPEPQLRQFVETWGIVPRKILSETSGQVFLTPFSSMFLHGGLLHLIGNMLYLWVFGDNIEDELGHAQFLIFYVGAGLAGAFLQTVLFPTTGTPMVGASGAIAGVLGAYLILYPQAEVLTVLIIVFLIRIVYIRAWFLLGFWIFIQFLHGSMETAGATGGGVAWFAHIGGFVVGVLIGFVYRKS